MNLTIGNKISIGFALALLALLVIGTTTSIDLEQLTTDAGWVTHTLEVQEQLEKLQAGLPEAESSARGYQLLAEPAFKSSFNSAVFMSQGALQALRTLTADNSRQQERLDRLEPLVETRFNQLQELIDMPQVSPGDAKRNLLIRNASETMGSIHQLLLAMGTEEQSLLRERRAQAVTMAGITLNTIVLGTLFAFALVAGVGLLISRSITQPLQELSRGASLIGGGQYQHRVQITSRDEVGKLAQHFNQMAQQVEHRQNALAEQDTLKFNLSRFASLFQGQRNLPALCSAVLSELAALLQARHSVFYIATEKSGRRLLQPAASYAFDRPKEEVAAGEGLAGQCLLDQKRIILTEIPGDYLRISSVLGSLRPVAVIVQPILFEGRTKAVLELAFCQPLAPIALVFLDSLAENLGVVLNTIEAGMITEELLEKTRASEALLQRQQEELQQSSEEMEQTNEELQQTNEEMEEKVNLLDEQKRQMERTNREIEQAREELEKRAQQIAQGSRYKSEFLANMSHELRTPLNSLLILAKMLADNADGNLNPKQVKYAQTIYSSGNDLLELINEVLDLAKIESGAVDFEPQTVLLAELRDFLEENFTHVAEGRKLGFRLEFDENCPLSIKTDPRRLQQILKNLLSNAFKFTEKGSVTVEVKPVDNGWQQTPGPSGTAPGAPVNTSNISLKAALSPQAAPTTLLDQADSVLAFSVRDTGTKIPVEKQEIIFGAFQQGDAGTARKFGGTGLGLSISRELAGLLGGSLRLSESSQMGNTFTLYLPTMVGSPQPRQKQADPVNPPLQELAVHQALMPDPEGIPDDREGLKPRDRVLLIIEDDKSFSELLRDFARDKEFKVVVARSAFQGVGLARQLKPSAITLDLHLPDNDGWVVFDRLKHDPETRHIPIHIISVDPERERSLRQGAVSYLQKPVTRASLDAALNQTIEFLDRPLKSLLIIEDDSVQRESLADLIGSGDVQTTSVGTAEEALTALERNRFDCIVLDLGLPDSNGVDLIQTIHRNLGSSAPPIIVYTGKAMSRSEETELRLISDSIVIKSVRSPERLLDETALFLHRVQDRLPESQQKMLEQVQKSDSLLKNRKVLIVDDDVRNIFAITSALEAMEMDVHYAESGQESIDWIEKNPDVEVILMDVMMPEMDGFETIRRIRRLPAFKKLPIISVTAKAMKDDREKCLEAGASDYITKPVDLDQLRSLLRVWLYR